MDATIIQGENRKPGGRNANERLRRRGMVPAVIYGHEQTPATVALSRHDLEIVLAHNQQVITLKVDGKDTQYLIKEVQYDHLQKDPLHVDLMRIRLGERVQVRVAVQLKGEPKGVRDEDGELVLVLNELEVECPVLEIPESFIVDVRELGLNDTLHVSDVTLPANVTLVTDAEEPIATIRPKRQVEEEEEEVAVEAGAAEGEQEPEVIGRGKEEDEGGEE